MAVSGGRGEPRKWERVGCHRAYQAVRKYLLDQCKLEKEFKLASRLHNPEDESNNRIVVENNTHTV